MALTPLASLKMPRSGGATENRSRFRLEIASSNPGATAGLAVWAGRGRGVRSLPCQSQTTVTLGGWIVFPFTCEG